MKGDPADQRNADIQARENAAPRHAKRGSGEEGAAIETENLWAGYGRKMVLRGLNLRIGKGDFIGLIGPNGSGKSTLMH